MHPATLPTSAQHDLCSLSVYPRPAFFTSGERLRNKSCHFEFENPGPFEFNLNVQIPAALPCAVGTGAKI